ncbi:MAG: FMN-binding glutamate synthase family protein [Myxococcota bacterium]
MIHRIRGYVLPILLLAVLGFAGLCAVDGRFGWVLAVLVPLAVLGVHDHVQTRHSILRNYPILGHLRFLLEDMGPELHQYMVESNTDGAPFDRDHRTLMYERAKNVEDTKPFGTELKVYASGYAWLTQSIAPRPVPERPSETLRVLVGAERAHPYDASILNISAMSFGALSANAIMALNRGAKRGGFAHDTGEGGYSRHHKQGGDIIYQVGTGYFGCRTEDGHFDAATFRETASDSHVKMIEIKISQGAKPGHGGILPGSKVTEEIAAARGVAPGVDCMSPTGHSAFSTPLELLDFVVQLRELSGDKPVGMKLCVGSIRELMAIAKAMVETGIVPDFITVDGAEGGTGAAPVEFTNHMGMPLREGLLLVHNTLVGIGVRDRLRIAASGKRVTGFDLSVAFALGADWCNVARGFMFSLGCIQSQRCHTNTCPVGVATQDAGLQRALVVEDKEMRAYQFHRNTVRALAEVVAACGLDHPSELTPAHIMLRINEFEIRSLDRLHTFFEPGQLVEGNVPNFLKDAWAAARPDRFGPA